MKAWAITEHQKPLEQIEMTLPEPKGSEVLLEVTHCGVCHTDLHLIDGYYDLGEEQKLSLQARGLKLPIAPGHEVLGRAVKLGPDAYGIGLGDRRIVYPWIGCSECPACKSGAGNMCAVANKSFGIFRNGGYATHVCVDAAYLVDPGDIEPAFACTLACSGITAYNAAKKILPPEPDMPVVVLGCGGLGLAAIAILKKLGQQAIIAVDVKDESLQAARVAGASASVNSLSAGDAVAEIQAAAGREILGVVDFVGSPITFNLGTGVLAKGGTFAVLGLYGGSVSLSIALLPIRAQTIVGCYAGSIEDLRELVALAQNNGLPALNIDCRHKSECNDILTDLKNGKIAGRVVMT